MESLIAAAARALEAGLDQSAANRTRYSIVREAEQHVGAKYVDQVSDSLYRLSARCGISMFGQRRASIPTTEASFDRCGF